MRGAPFGPINSPWKHARDGSKSGCNAYIHDRDVQDLWIDPLLSSRTRVVATRYPGLMPETCLRTEIYSHVTDTTAHYTHTIHTLYAHAGRYLALRVAGVLDHVDGKVKCVRLVSARRERLPVPGFRR